MVFHTTMDVGNVKLYFLYHFKKIKKQLSVCLVLDPAATCVAHAYSYF
jgi:hypothetical protein